MREPSDRARRRTRPVHVAALAALGLPAVFALWLFVSLVPRFPCACRESVLPIQLQKLADAAREYVWFHGRCPTFDDLAKQGLIMQDQRKDPWGRDLRIRCTSRSVEARSAGKDAAFDTPDDRYFSLFAVTGGTDSGATARTTPCPSGAGAVESPCPAAVVRTARLPTF
ncbi:MAG: hypothetical protein HY905_03785 [Deltaproteobacteria bacterium]|nr:hypothetical protein [Deltaproteobacteria bacterium]